MSNIDDIHSAIINAGNAGDGEAVRTLAKYLETLRAPPAPNKNQNTGLGGDLATDIKRGFLNLPGQTAELLDTPGHLMGFEGSPVTEAGEWLAGKTGIHPSDKAEAAKAEYSPGRQQSQKELTEAWESPSLTLDPTTWSNVAKTIALNPGATLGNIVGSVPGMISGGVYGKGIKAAGKYLGREVGSGVALGGGEGLVTTGQIGQQLKEEAPGVDPQTRAMAATGAGLFTAGIGGAAQQLAGRFGVQTLERAVLGGELPAAELAAFKAAADKALSARIGSGVLVEGILQELPQGMQEQMWQNWAEGKPILEGVARAGVEGALSGSALGGGMNALQNPAKSQLAEIEAIEKLKKQATENRQKLLEEKGIDYDQELVDRQAQQKVQEEMHQRDEAQRKAREELNQREQAAQEEIDRKQAAVVAQAKEYQTAAAQGDKSAQNFLGNMYYHGQGVPQDTTIAATLYKRAADRGFADAQFNLASLYVKGEGVKQDIPAAIKLLELAAANGHVNAQKALQVIRNAQEGGEARGEGVQLDIPGVEQVAEGEGTEINAGPEATAEAPEGAANQIGLFDKESGYGENGIDRTGAQGIAAVGEGTDSGIPGDLGGQATVPEGAQETNAGGLGDTGAPAGRPGKGAGASNKRGGSPLIARARAAWDGTVPFDELTPAEQQSIAKVDPEKSPNAFNWLAEKINTEALSRRSREAAAAENIQKSTQEDNEPIRYQRGKKPARGEKSTVASFMEAFNKLFPEGYRGKNKPIIINDASDAYEAHPDPVISEQIRQKVINNPGIRAFVVTATGQDVYITNRIPKGKETALIMHEYGVHTSLSKLIGAGRRDRLANQISFWAKQIITKENAVHVELAKKAIRHVEGLKYTRGTREYSEESIAYFTQYAIEKYGIEALTGLTKQRNAVITWLQNLWAGISETLKKIDLNINALTTNDIVSLVYGAARVSSFDPAAPLEGPISQPRAEAKAEPQAEGEPQAEPQAEGEPQAEPKVEPPEEPEIHRAVDEEAPEEEYGFSDINYRKPTKESAAAAIRGVYNGKSGIWGFLRKLLDRIGNALISNTYSAERKALDAKMGEFNAQGIHRGDLITQAATNFIGISQDALMLGRLILEKSGIMRAGRGVEGANILDLTRVWHETLAKATEKYGAERAYDMLVKGWYGPRYDSLEARNVDLDRKIEELTANKPKNWAKKVREYEDSKVNVSDWTSDPKKAADAKLARSEFAAGFAEMDKIRNQMRAPLLQTMVGTGLYTEEQAAEYLENADYVPMYRVQEKDLFDANKNHIRAGRGLLGMGKEFRIHGSDLLVADPIQNFSANMSWMMQRAIKNNAAIHMANMLEELGAGRWATGPLTNEEKHKNLTVVIYREGMPQDFILNDPLDAAAFASPPVATGSIITAMKYASAALRHGVTSMPQFVFNQAWQDSMRAYLVAGNKDASLLRYTKDTWASIFNNQFRAPTRTAQILKSFGVTGQKDTMDAQALEDVYTGKNKKGWRKTAFFFERLAHGSDLGAREAIFDAAKKELLAQGVSEELAESTAAIRANRYMPYQQVGTSQSLAYLRALVPFINPPIQGWARDIAAARGRLTGVSTAAGKKALLFKLTKYAMFVAAYAAMRSGDDDYEKKTEDQRDDNLWIGTKISVPQELRPFKVLIERMTRSMIFSGGSGKVLEDPVVAGRVLKKSYEIAAGLTPIPTLFKPEIEAVTNYDWHTMKPIVGSHNKNLSPQFQTNSTTSELAKIVGEALNIPGLSPVHIDHYLQGHLGLVGAAIGDFSNVLMSDSKVPMNKWPVVGSIIGGNAHPSGDMEAFYELKNHVAQVRGDYKSIIEKGRAGELPAFVKENKAYLSDWTNSAVNKIGTKLTELNAAERTMRGMSLEKRPDKEEVLENIRNAKDRMLNDIHRIRQSLDDANKR